MNAIPENNTDEQAGGRRSPGLVLMGVAGLFVAGWGLSGGVELPAAAHFGWAAIGIGLVVGLILIFTGARSSRS